MSLELPEFEAFVQEKMSETSLPGVSVAIVKQGRVAYSRGFGLRDVAARLPATPETLYGIGSITKSFTALAISQLVDDGRLDFHDPVGKYFPVGLASFKRVTLHHLLTHSSGMPALGYAEAYISRLTGIDNEVPAPPSTPEGIASFMADSDDWREAEPGERFFYLNEGYALLGAVISRVTGMPYAEFVRERILEPLSMKETFFAQRDVDAKSDRATPYIIHEGKPTATSFPYGLTADGGLVSNVLDLSKYLTMYLGRGTFEGNRVVSLRSLQEMEKARIGVPHPLVDHEEYGYGLRITPDFFGQRLVHHGGSVYVHTGFLGYLPEAETGIAILANASGYSPSDLGAHALAALMGRDPSSLPFVRSANLMKGVEGHYLTYGGTKRAQISREGDFLRMHFSDGFPAESIVLMPDRLDEHLATFHTFIGSRRYDAEFRVYKRPVELVFERYKFRRSE